jgi:hypothetical protein
MSKSTRVSTKDINSRGFAPHGAMDLVVSDRLNVIEAEGPFNVELVTAGDTAQEKVDAELQAKGKWATMLIFRKSAMASFEVLTEIENILKRRIANGIHPVGVAIVMNSGVEGASIMRPYYVKAYTNAGLLARGFEEEKAAQEWLTTLIDS